MARTHMKFACQSAIDLITINKIFVFSQILFNSLAYNCLLLALTFCALRFEFLLVFIEFYFLSLFIKKFFTKILKNSFFSLIAHNKSTTIFFLELTFNMQMNNRISQKTWSKKCTMGRGSLWFFHFLGIFFEKNWYYG